MLLLIIELIVKHTYKILMDVHELVSSYMYKLIYIIKVVNYIKRDTQS